jgi:hypothetical protein
MEASKGSFRYKMFHLGDILVSKMEKGFRFLSRANRGVVITYDLRELKRKRKIVLTKIGTRMSDLKTISPDLEIFNDTDLSQLFSQLAKIEHKIEQRLDERERRLYPYKFENQSFAAAA